MSISHVHTGFVGYFIFYLDKPVIYNYLHMHHIKTGLGHINTGLTGFHIYSDRPVTYVSIQA